MMGGNLVMVNSEYEVRGRASTLNEFGIRGSKNVNLVTVLRTGLLLLRLLLLLLELFADLEPVEGLLGSVAERAPPEDEEGGLLRPLPLPLPSLSISVNEKLRDSQRASSDCILSASNELSTRLSEGFERLSEFSKDGESSMALRQTNAGV